MNLYVGLGCFYWLRNNAHSQIDNVVNSGTILVCAQNCIIVAQTTSLPFIPYTRNVNVMSASDIVYTRSGVRQTSMLFVSVLYTNVDLPLILSTAADGAGEWTALPSGALPSLLLPVAIMKYWPPSLWHPVAPVSPC